MSQMGSGPTVESDLLAVLRWVKWWLWLPNLIVVGAAVAYLLWVWGLAFIEWVKAGGVQ